MSTMNRPGIPWRQRLQESPQVIVVELTLIGAVFVADAYHLILFSKTPYLLALGWLSMRLRGQRWGDIGLRFPLNWLRLLLIGLAGGIAMELLELFAIQPLLVALTGKYPDLSDFHSLIGNVRLLLLIVAGSWIVAGIGEELVWRGYVLNRVADLLGRSRLGWAVSIGIVSFVFGPAPSRGRAPSANDMDPLARLVLLTKSLDVRFAVGIEELFAALLPSCFEFWSCNVPVRPAFLSDGTQVLA